MPLAGADLAEGAGWGYRLPILVVAPAGDGAVGLQRAGVVLPGADQFIAGAGRAVGASVRSWRGNLRGDTNLAWLGHGASERLGQRRAARHGETRQQHQAQQGP